MIYFEYSLTLCHVSNFKQLWKLTLHNSQSGSSAFGHLNTWTFLKISSKTFELFAKKSGIFMYIYILIYYIKTWCWDCGQNLLLIRKKEISLMCWPKDWGRLRLFIFCTVDASMGTYAKVKRIVWRWILVLHHFFTNIMVSTVNFSSPEMT